MEIVFNRPRSQTAPWNTRQRKHTKPPPRRLIKLRQELPTREHTQPGRAGPGGTVRAIQATKPSIPHLIRGVRETADDKIAQRSIQSETLTPSETITQGRTRIPDKPLSLAGILSGILMLAGILVRIPMLAGIFTRILRLGAPEEIEISDRTQTVSSRMQIRLKKRYQRRKWIIYRKPGKKSGC